jgi:DDE superfamily endonuclease
VPCAALPGSLSGGSDDPVGVQQNKVATTSRIKVTTAVKRAYQRDPVAIERWQRETFPAIAQQAGRDDADIFFWDESGFRADSVHGKTWAQRGETPVVERLGQRQSVSAASAVNSRGAFWFDTYQGGLTGELFVTLLKKLIKGITGSNLLLQGDSEFGRGGCSPVQILLTQGAVQAD